MSCIPRDMDWQKLALAFGKAKIGPQVLRKYGVSKGTLYRIRSGKQPNPPWCKCGELWDAANDRLGEEEIANCTK